MLALKAMYVAATVGAGLVGGLTVLAPAHAGKFIFGGDLVVDNYVRILGALWVSLGLVAILGLQRPEALIPLLLIQLIYKSVWLLVVAYPALWHGERSGGMIFLSTLFTIWVIALVTLVPFGRWLASSG